MNVRLAKVLRQLENISTMGIYKMGSVVQMLEDRGLIKPPRFLATNVHYETMMGSVAYGVESSSSDIDIYGIAIPPKDIVFPHLRGEILGFDTPQERFEQYQQHHIELANKHTSYDLSIYNIVKFFRLAMQNNPNIIDSLFTPQFCVLHITRVGQMIREQRRMFLHKGSWHKFKGYAYSQLHKTTLKTKSEELVEILKFEDIHSINHSASLDDVLNEMKRREISGI